MVAPQTFLSSSIFLVVLSLIASWYITYCFALQLIIEYLYRFVSFCTLLSVTRKYRYSLFLSNAYCLSFCFAKYSCKRHRFESPSHFHLIVASLHERLTKLSTFSYPPDLGKPTASELSSREFTFKSLTRTP